MDDKRSGKSEGGTTGYTTRLNDEQARVVEDAAKILNVTTAKFIRDAAIARASEVVNSQGRNALALRQFAVQMATQLMDPLLEVTGLAEHDMNANKPGFLVRGAARRSSIEELRQMWLGEYDMTQWGCRPLHAVAFAAGSIDAQSQIRLGMDGNDDFEIAQAIEVVDVMPSSIDNVEQIRDALKSAPSVLGHYLWQELDAQGSTEIRYKPVVHPDSMLSGDSEG